MERASILHFAFLLAAVLPLVSCEGTPQPRQAVFNDADFRWSSGTGTGSVVGQGYAEIKDNSIRYVQNTSVDISPVNAYTTEIIEKRFIKGQNLAPANPRFLKYGRTAPTDATGHFAFHHLPPGEYYVASSVDWKNWNWSPEGEGLTYKVWIQYAAPIYAKVSVRNGQTVRVTDWIYGKERSW